MWVFYNILSVGFLQHTILSDIIEILSDIIEILSDIIEILSDIIKYNSQESDLNPHTDLLKMLPWTRRI